MPAIPNKPIIHLYSGCWNEEYMLKYFFRHYDQFVDRYIILDDGSTDQTLEILGEHPNVEIRSIELVDENSKLLSGQHIVNNVWKESRGIADWIIYTDVDEFLYSPNLINYLIRCANEGVTAIPALGYQMISSTLPSSDQSILELVKRGCPWNLMNKLSIFDPNKIQETNQIVGRHKAEPVGEVKYPDVDELLLLHYKYLSFEYVYQRNRDLKNKLRSFDKEKGWGHKYSWTREQLQKDWDQFEQNSVENVFSPEYDPHLMHSSLSYRWWRKDARAL